MEKENKNMDENKNKSNKLLIIIISALLLLILISVAIGFYFLNSDTKKAAQVSQVDQEKIQHFERDNPTLSKDLGGEEALNKIGPLYQLDPFTVNVLSENEGEKYLLVTISLELSSKELEGELIAKQAVIRNLIIEILSSKTIESISSDTGKEAVSLEIIKKINEMLSDGRVKNIYFTKFITQ